MEKANKSAKYLRRKNTNNNQAKLGANKKPQDHVADIKDKHILQNIEEVFTKSLTNSRKYFNYLASN